MKKFHGKNYFPKDDATFYEIVAASFVQLALELDILLTHSKMQRRCVSKKIEE